MKHRFVCGCGRAHSESIAALNHARLGESALAPRACPQARRNESQQMGDIDLGTSRVTRRSMATDVGAMKNTMKKKRLVVV